MVTQQQHQSSSTTALNTRRDAPTALVTVPEVQVIEQQPERLIDDFAWFDPAHRQQAAAYAQGLQIAVARKLTLQIPLYVNFLRVLVATDVKDRLCALVRQNTGKTPCCYEHPNQSALPTHQFNAEADSQWEDNRWVKYRWVYSPLTAFARLIPPQALGAMLNLEEQAAIRPQAYWVADLVKVDTAQRSLDPVLFAQLHHWFVTIAAWQ